MSTEKQRINKSVSFSSVDKYEMELLDYAMNQGNFSKYIKRLIMLDKEGVKREVSETKPVVKPIIDDKIKNAMKSVSLK